MGNLQAPPVYSDTTIVPAPGAANVVAPPGTVVAPPGTTVVAPAHVVAPAMATPAAVAAAPASMTVRPVGCPGIATPLGTCAPQGARYLRLTPNGIMAPVGTEVVLKAGVADCDGSLLVNRPVEWGVAGPGQFTELGAAYQVGSFAWPWQRPRRIAANHALSTTAFAESTLYSGTDDPIDDVPIYRGEAWVTVTSPCEGTSLVTAFTPSLDNYNRVTVPIYWVDAQFLFPQSTAAEPGRPHVLTTTVMRRSDGAPLAGWTVRYDVARGASLGYEGGNFVEARTDAAGRASVEVSPVDSGSGTTTVGVSIFRPAAGGPGGMPPQGVARGSATITWGGVAPVVPVSPPTGAAPPALPPTVDPYAPSLPPTSPIIPSQAPSAGAAPPMTMPPAAQPDVPAPPDRYTPPAGESTTGRPRLSVDLRPTTGPQVALGEYARFELVITNNGDATARQIKLRDDFPLGLRHEKAQPGETAIVNDKVPDIAPGQSTTVPLTFEVVAEGQHCHTVTVTAEGADTVSKQGCVAGIKPSITSFDITGHVSRTVGERAQFDILIKNGDLPARNVGVVLRFDPALELIAGADSRFERLQDGSYLMRIGDLAANEQRTFKQQPIEAMCKEDNRNACVNAELMVGGALVLSDQACVDILPAAGGLGAPGP
jgi:uncharacterized repeat protein (TIGR01451 family)